MRKLLLLFVISLFLPLSSVFSQTFEDYVLEFRGDTAVIKDFFDFTPNEKNTPHFIRYCFFGNVYIGSLPNPGSQG